MQTVIQNTVVEKLYHSRLFCSDLTKLISKEVKGGPCYVTVT
jgi:hypothetical protein